MAWSRTFSSAVRFRSRLGFWKMIPTVRRTPLGVRSLGRGHRRRFGDHGRHLPRVRALVGRDGTLAQGANMFGSTPLHAAWFGGHDAIVALLLEQGAPVEWRLHSSR